MSETLKFGLELRDEHVERARSPPRGETCCAANGRGLHPRHADADADARFARGAAGVLARHRVWPRLILGRAGTGNYSRGLPQAPFTRAKSVGGFCAVSLWPRKRCGGLPLRETVARGPAAAPNAMS